MSENNTDTDYSYLWWVLIVSDVFVRTAWVQMKTLLGSLHIYHKSENQRQTKFAPPGWYSLSRSVRIPYGGLIRIQEV